jgi:hypothetical protein
LIILRCHTFKHLNETTFCLLLLHQLFQNFFLSSRPILKPLTTCKKGSGQKSNNNCSKIYCCKVIEKNLSWKLNSFDFCVCQLVLEFIVSFSRKKLERFC